MSSPWFLGVDLGTGSCKAMIIDQDLNILGIASAAYPQNKWKEQDADATIQSMFLAVRKVIEKAGVLPENCSALSFGCALHGVMAVDKHGDPLSGVMTWSDDRARQQAGWLREEYPGQELYQINGCPVHWMYWPAKLIWLKENDPERFAKCAKFISIKDYILQKLTGEYICDYSVAGGSGFLDVRKLRWDQQIMKITGVREEQFSAPVSPHKVYQGINSEFAQQMNLPEKVLLVVGASDAANSSLGAGAVQPDQATCMIGTSAAMRVIMPQPKLDELGRSWCYPFDDDHWLVGGALNNGGIALSWLKDMVNSALPSGENKFAFEDIFRLAESVEPGARGLMILPYFAGERSPNWSLNSRAVMYGLTLEHDMQHISRALLEAVCMRLCQLTTGLGDMQIQLNQIRTSGGGTRSRFWMQMLADVLGKEISLTASEETSSLGTALWALKGAGYISDFSNMHQKIGIKTTFTPDEKLHQVYSRIFENYRDLNQLLRPYQDAYRFDIEE